MATYDSKLYAVHGINRYLWSRLQTLNSMNPSKYVGRINNGPNINWIPIMPTQMIEEFTEATDVDGEKAPFIVYNWNVESIAQSWFIQSEQIIYVVYSDSEESIRQVTKTMINLFKRWDTSADEVNNWINDPANSLSAEYKKFEYKSISIQAANGPLPVEEAGSRLQALITLRATYTETD